MEITIDELLKINNPNIIDIRSYEKYNDRHIPGAVNINYIELVNNTSKYLNKINKYFIYCQRGITSRKVVSILRNYGYNVINIIGGYEAYILK